MFIVYLTLQFHPGALLLGLHLLGLVNFDALQETVPALWVLHMFNAHVDSLGQDSASVKDNSDHSGKIVNINDSLLVVLQGSITQLFYDGSDSLRRVHSLYKKLFAVLFPELTQFTNGLYLIIFSFHTTTSQIQNAICISLLSPLNNPRSNRRLDCSVEGSNALPHVNDHSWHEEPWWQSEDGGHKKPKKKISINHVNASQLVGVWWQGFIQGTTLKLLSIRKKYVTYLTCLLTMMPTACWVTLYTRPVLPW